jgi:hypothetical protein
MAAELRHKWTANPSFQEANSTVHWWWPEGENQHYWGYSVRPWQFNSDLETVRQWTTTDNGNAWTEHFLLRTTSGGLMRFSAIWVIGA